MALITHWASKLRALPNAWIPCMGDKSFSGPVREDVGGFNDLKIAENKGFHAFVTELVARQFVAVWGTMQAGFLRKRSLAVPFRSAYLERR